jgi:hypothetical protein
MPHVRYDSAARPALPVAAQQATLSRRGRASCAAWACCSARTLSGGSRRGGPSSTSPSRTSSGAPRAAPGAAGALRKQSQQRHALCHTHRCPRHDVTHFARRCRRTIKTTEIAWGTALKLFLRPALVNARLTGACADGKGREAYAPELDFARRKVDVDDEAAWAAATAGQPLTSAARRGRHVSFLRAKLRAADAVLQREGLHGLWELAVRPDFPHEPQPGARRAAAAKCVCLMRTSLHRELRRTHQRLTSAWLA